MTWEVCLVGGGYGSDQETASF